MNLSYIKTVFCFASIGLITSSGCVSFAQNSNFIANYIKAKGGCSNTSDASNLFANVHSDMPFDKKAEDWTDSDIVLLKGAADECVSDATRVQPQTYSYLVRNEQFLLERVSQAVKEGRRRHDLRERQIVEAKEASVMRELQGYRGHIMSAAELDRAQQLKEENPGLAFQIEGLLADQNRLKQQAAQQENLQREQAVAAQRIEAERQKSVLDEQRSAEEAAIEAEKKQQTFAKSLPHSCNQAHEGREEMQSKETQDKVTRAASLAEAGDAASACSAFTVLASKMESLRANFVKCTKDLDADLDPLARQEASNALNAAIEIHSKQAGMTKFLAELKCN